MPGEMLLRPAEMSIKRKEQVERTRSIAKKHPKYLEAKDGSGGFTWQLRVTQGSIMTIPPPENEKRGYDVKELSSFFELSQDTGFSKQRLCKFYTLWTNSARGDMNKSQFVNWMKNVGFPEPTVVRRLFDVFDVDSGGSIDYEECCIGLSYIMFRDDKYNPLQRTDKRFYQICFRLMDLQGDGELTMFEFFKVVQSAADLSAKQALAIVSSVFALLDPRKFGSVSSHGFETILMKHEEYWAFMRQILLMLSLQNHTSREYMKAHRGFRELCVAIGAPLQQRPGARPWPDYSDSSSSDYDD